MSSPRDYLDPAALARLKGLSLKARLIVEGTMAGLHRSPHQGFSVEFAEHREYAPGDDLRHVDWKVFAKSDRFYLKQYEEETDFHCWLLLDASESMTYRSDGVPLSKLEYARLLAAALAWLVVRQQDAAGLAVFDERVRQFVRASSQPAHLSFLLETMDRAQPGERTRLGPVLHELAERIVRRGVVVVFSDLFDEPADLLRGLRHFRFQRHDVTVLQIVDPAEADFPFDTPTLFKGLEGWPEQRVDPRSLRAAYQREYAQFNRSLATGCREMNIDHFIVRTDERLDAPLRRLLSRRLSRPGRT